MEFGRELLSQIIFNRFDIVTRFLFIFLDFQSVFFSKRMNGNVWMWTNTGFRESRQKIELEADTGAQIGKFGEIFSQRRGLVFVTSIQRGKRMKSHFQGL